MLSRTADNLFWLSRYVERAEYLARILDATQRLSALPLAYVGITLARKDYFNGSSIHRVVPDFVVQDGDPRGDGEGGPGYTIRDELNERPYLRGTVGMARYPWPDSGGSQFFITVSPQPHLDAKLHRVRPRHRSGMDVVDQIEVVERDPARARVGWPADDGEVIQGSGIREQGAGKRLAPEGRLG